MKRGIATERGCWPFSPIVLFRRCDVSKSEDLEAIRDELVKLWGGVEVVINNAGVAGVAGFIEDTTVTDWDWVLNINLLGVVRGCRTFIPVMKAQGYGHIVNIALYGRFDERSHDGKLQCEQSGCDFFVGNPANRAIFFRDRVVCGARHFLQPIWRNPCARPYPGMESKVHKMMARSGVSAEDGQSNLRCSG